MRQTIRDVMTANPRTVTPSTSVVDAARVMRESDIGDVVVIAEGRLCGILTDRDIVVRALAEGRDPVRTRVGDICSQELITVSPDESLGA